MELQTLDIETPKTVSGANGQIIGSVNPKTAIAAGPWHQGDGLAPQSGGTAQPRRQGWNGARPRRWNITWPQRWRVWRPRSWTMRRLEWEAARVAMGVERGPK